jgi:segregation and condensation protein A
MTYKIKLEIFEGPLDLLLYLIKEDELNIYDIPITRITEQYLEYINLMQELDLDIAGEFLVMAATLMHIKSKMLLPPDPAGIETEEPDPRSELVKRLLEYKAFKEASERLRVFEAERGKIFTRTNVEPEKDENDLSLVDVSLFELLNAFSKVLKGLQKNELHEIVKDEFTVAEKVHEIFHRLAKRPVVYFSELFTAAKNKLEVITTFLALLELVRLREVLVKQPGHFGEIEISRNPKMIVPVNGANENG